MNSTTSSPKHFPTLKSSLRSSQQVHLLLNPHLILVSSSVELYLLYNTRWTKLIIGLFIYCIIVNKVQNTPSLNKQKIRYCFLGEVTLHARHMFLEQHTTWDGQLDPRTSPVDGVRCAMSPIRRRFTTYGSIWWNINWFKMIPSISFGERRYKLYLKIHIFQCRSFYIQKYIISFQSKNIKIYPKIWWSILHYFRTFRIFLKNGL